MNIPNPNLSSLFASRPNSTDIDLNLAARYAPILRFDAREPFLPLAVGYSIFRKNTPSPSFPRRIELRETQRPAAELAIEYAIWWDWEIVHFYELEHIWVFLDNKGQIIRSEASWHGDYQNMSGNSSLQLTNERLNVVFRAGQACLCANGRWVAAKG